MISNLNKMQPRRQSSGDDEDIIVKPSTELIADEYEHSVKTTNNIAVHTFASKSDKDQDNISSFIQTLNKNSYQIKSENSHCLDTDSIFDVLHKIREHTEELDGLILYFSGKTSHTATIDAFNGQDVSPINIQEIWDIFTSYKCLGLKNKPKIFIFHVTSPAKIETDSRKLRRFPMATTYDLAYETPAEADILIIYHKTESSYHREFIDQLCKNIDKYGKHEDIISIVTCTESIAFETRPMIISTLTKKFYFTVSEYRGLHLSIDQNHKQLREGLKEVDQKLSQVNRNPQKKNKLVDSNTGYKHSVELSNEVTSKEKNTNLKRVNIVPDSSSSGIRLATVSKDVLKSRKISQTDSEGGRSRKSVEEPKAKWTFKGLK